MGLEDREQQLEGGLKVLQRGLPRQEQDGYVHDLT
jgi:hypothetical protein